MIQFQEYAWTEGHKDELQDEETLFHRFLQATAGGSKIGWDILQEIMLYLSNVGRLYNVITAFFETKIA